MGINVRTCCDIRPLGSGWRYRDLARCRSDAPRRLGRDLVLCLCISDLRQRGDMGATRIHHGHIHKIMRQRINWDIWYGRARKRRQTCQGWGLIARHGIGRGDHGICLVLDLLKHPMADGYLRHRETGSRAVTPLTCLPKPRPVKGPRGHAGALRAHNRLQMASATRTSSSPEFSESDKSASVRVPFGIERLFAPLGDGLGSDAWL